MNGEALWTVTQLPEGMDTLWTAQDEWTNSKSCPQAAHPLLGQVIKMTSDLTTVAWITAQLDNAVTHTDHSANDDEIFVFEEDRKKEINWTKSESSLTKYGRKIPVDRRGKTNRHN